MPNLDSPPPRSIVLSQNRYTILRTLCSGPYICDDLILVEPWLLASTRILFDETFYAFSQDMRKDVAFRVNGHTA